MDIASKQLIKQETILKWFEANPVTQLLTLDWKNARQTTIDGKSVVRIPTLNVDKTAMLNTNETILQLNSLSSNGVYSGNKNKLATETNNDGNRSNYYSEHPPEVFVIENENATKITPYLLNFVPTNPSKEFGKDSLWTGKLYEWNLKGDTVFVQNILKSKFINKFAVKIGLSHNNNSQGAVMSLDLKKKASIFGDIFNWLGGLFSDIWTGINYIGYYLGVPGSWINNDDGWRTIRIWTFDWLTGDGGGGGDGSYTGAGYPIYDSYTPGYQYPDGGYNGGGYNDWSPYPHGGGGTGGPNPNGPMYSVSLSYLMEKLLLTPDQIDF